MKKIRINALIALSVLCISTAVVAETSVVVVQGLAGEEYYQRHFDEQVEKIKNASSKLVKDDQIVTFNADATKQEILTDINRIINAADSDDLLALYLIGHGSYDGRDYKFNISGADITGTELFEILSQAPNSTVLINTSSSSGALLKLFKEQDNNSKVHLITATKSGAERTATRFGRHLADALTQNEADINKNQSISLQEAFDYSVRQTQDFYDTEGLLATENARLQMANNSTQAGQLRLANLAERPAAAVSSELASLYQQRDELDRQIDTLRLRRINISEDDYLQQFQTLMINLSLLQGQIDEEAVTQ